MKKIILALASVSVLMVSIASCTTTASPNNPDASSTPVASGSPAASATPASGTDSSVHLRSKAAFLAFLNCVKAKSPSPIIDARIEQALKLDEAIFPTNVEGFTTIIESYKSTGC